MEKIKLQYDKEGDVLEVFLRNPEKAVSEEMQDDIVMHRSLKDKKVIGFTVLNFGKRFEKQKAREIVVTVRK